MKNRFIYVVLAVLGSAGLAACDGGPLGDLASYEGSRPLTLLRVTQHYTPDLQWVGGRVAAVGVNRGSVAALDTSLVWLMVAPGDTINRFATIGPHNAADLVRQFGGTPVDSLADGVAYTFWLAEKGAFDEGLSAAVMADPLRFADTTVTVRYLLNGRSGGDPRLDAAFTIVREQTLLADRYVVRWTAAGANFRQIGLSRGTLGAFSNLVWHVVVPDEAAAGVASPVVLGTAPEGTATAVEWPGTGFEPTTYILWMTTPEWDGTSFGLRTPGYAYFQIFSSNFE